MVMDELAEAELCRVHNSDFVLGGRLWWSGLWVVVVIGGFSMCLHFIEVELPVALGV